MKILLIEDSPEDARIFKKVLADDRELPCELAHADRLDAGLARLAEQPVELIILDLFLPDSRGIDTLIRVREAAPRIPIVVLTAVDDKALASEALRRGAQDYLVKGYVQIYRTLLGRSLRYAVERKRAEEQVDRAHARTQTLLASIPSILIGVDQDGHVTHWNAVAEATFSVAAAQAIGHPLAACGVPWDATKLLEHLGFAGEQQETTRLDEIAFKRPNGLDGFLGFTVVPIKDERAANGGFLLFGADITERRQTELERSRLQQELTQAQKIETIGRFAGGIAHDFQNVLQVILGFAWLLRSKAPESSELRGYVEEIIHAAESAAGMVRQLLAFSRRQALRPTVLELNQTVQSAERMLQQLVGESIRLDVQLTAEPILVRLDPTAFEQIMINLCSNARDSMSGGGVLTIRTACLEADAALVQAHGGTKPGMYVRLSVQDTGTGMDPEVARHIFEPFFTTKQQGKGTGLGLAVVYGLVRQHDGFVAVDTAPGKGTAFHLYFPHQDLLKAAQEAAPPEIPSPRKSQPIALIQHDERQRGFTTTIVREAGYELIAAGESPDVLAALRQRPSVELVIVDISGQDMTDQGFLARLRDGRPDRKLLLVCGYIDERLRALEGSWGGVQVLQKPYVPAQLLEALKRLLDQPYTPQLPGLAPTAPGRGKRSVLIVDDEPAIRHLCVQMLQEHYAVATAGSAQEALSELARSSYDVLLTDINMPGQDGFVLIERAAEVQPGLKVVTMSGVANPEMEERLRRAPIRSELIRKPFTAEALQEQIKRCL